MIAITVAGLQQCMFATIFVKERLKFVIKLYEKVLNKIVRKQRIIRFES